MRKRKYSVRFIMSISFVTLIIITFSIIGYFVFSGWKASVQNIVTKIEKDTNRDIIDRVDSFIESPLHNNEVNHILIESGVANLQDKKERERYFVGVLKSSNDDVYSFSYGTEIGEYYGARRNERNEIEIMENNSETNGQSWYYAVNSESTAGNLASKTEKFDARSRDWYIAAKEKQVPVYSPIYKHFVMPDLAISAAYPIYDKKNVLQGVLGTHIILSKMNSYLKQIAKDKNADVYILEKNSGELVANSAGKPNLKDLGNNKIERIKISKVDNKPIIEAYNSYNKNLNKYLVVYTKEDKFHTILTNYKRDGIDWLIITSIPESQFTGGITKNIQIAMLLSVCVLIVAIIISIKYTDSVLKPIYYLIDATKKFSQGDFSIRAKIYRNDEIGKLSGEFNNMADQLYVFINKLEEKVTERTVKLEAINLELKNSEGSLHLLLNSTAEAIYGIDINGNCTFCNASFLIMLRYDNQDELIGKNMYRLLHNISVDSIEGGEAIVSTMSVKEHEQWEEDILWRSDGSCFPIEYFSHAKYVNGKISGAVITFMDISQRKKSEEDIIYLSYHDQLTGLYNRRYFEKELKRLDNKENLPLTIVMADMNGLKLINDSLGHVLGDELLKRASELMAKGCRKKDIISRIGGDEFVILMPNTEAYEAEKSINGIMELALGNKVESFDVSISFGYGTRKNIEETMQQTYKIAEENMYKKKLIESPNMRIKMINAIIGSIYEKDKGEEEHSHRVSELCRHMGEVLHLPIADIEDLKVAGLLHDIGKMAIDRAILNKPEELTNIERKEIKRHPEVGYRILSAVNDMSALAEYVLAHHERWDGSGYPKGLKGIEIPLPSRIIAIAEAYDSMLSGRSYHNALSDEAVIKELKTNMGTQFDPELIVLFIEKILNKPFDLN